MRRLMILIEAHAPPLFPQLYDGAQGEVVPDHSAVADTILGAPTAFLRAAEAMPDSGVNDQKQKQGHRLCCRRPCSLHEPSLGDWGAARRAVLGDVDDLVD